MCVHWDEVVFFHKWKTGAQGPIWLLNYRPLRPGGCGAGDGLLNKALGMFNNWHMPILGPQDHDNLIESGERIHDAWDEAKVEILPLYTSYVYALTETRVLLFPKLNRHTASMRKKTSLTFYRHNQLSGMGRNIQHRLSLLQRNSGNAWLSKKKSFGDMLAWLWTENQAEACYCSVYWHLYN